MIVAAHERPARVFKHHVAVRDVAITILLRQFQDRRPRAEIAPRALEAADRRLPRALHHGIVDRNRGRGPIRLAIKPEEIQILRRCLQRGTRRLQDLRLECPQLVQEHLRSVRKHTGVPKVVAADQQALRRGDVRLLNELVDRIATSRIRQRSANADITVARLGARGRNAERSDEAGDGGPRGRLNRLGEHVDVADVMIGGQQEYDAVRVIALDHQRSDGGGRRRVAADRLQHDARVGDFDLAQLLGDQKAVLFVADNDRCDRPGPLRAQNSFLQQCAFAHQPQQLLRHRLARERPQARAAAARHDHRINRGRFHTLNLCFLGGTKPSQRYTQPQ